MFSVYLYSLVYEKMFYIFNGTRRFCLKECFKQIQKPKLNKKRICAMLPTPILLIPINLQPDGVHIIISKFERFTTSGCKDIGTIES